MLSSYRLNVYFTLFLQESVFIVILHSFVSL